MRAICFALVLITSFTPVRGFAQDTPADIVRKTLDAVTNEFLSQLDTSFHITRVFPVVSSELPEDQIQPVIDLWRRSLHAAGKEVYVNPQTGTYRTELRVDTYTILVNSEKSGWFGKQRFSGVMNLSGDVLVADTSGKVIHTTTFEFSESFETSKKQDVWFAEETQQHFPVRYSNLQDHPEIRTILLAVTSAMIIYLFYSMRG